MREVLVGISLRLVGFRDILGVAVAGDSQGPGRGPDGCRAVARLRLRLGQAEEPKIERFARARYHPSIGGGGDPGSSQTYVTPAKRNARSLTRRSDVGDEETNLEQS